MSTRDNESAVSNNNNMPKKKTFWETLTSEKYFKWTLLIPLILILAAFMLYPLIYNLFMSFHEFTLRIDPEFTGLDNYRELLRNMTFWSALGRNALVLVICITVEVVLGFAIALTFNRKFRGQNVIQGLCLLPLMLSPLAMSLMWNYMLHIEFGIVNQLLRWVGLSPVEFLADPNFALFSIMGITIWQWTPFSIFVILAGLRGIRPDIVEATQVDGASFWFVLRKITLPMLKPLLIIIIMLRTMWLIRLYDPLYGTTQGGVRTELLDWYITRVAFIRFDIGTAGAMAIVALFITIILANLLYQQLIKALGASEET